jgi:hypothetical protein
MVLWRAVSPSDILNALARLTPSTLRPAAKAVTVSQPGDVRPPASTDNLPRR